MVELSAKTFDLRDAAEDGAWCQLYHPITREALGEAEGALARIKLQGVDSMGFESTIAKTAAMRANEPARRGQLSEKRLLMLAEQAEQTQSRELADISLEWENIEWKGEPVSDKHSARAMYEQNKWMREQLIEFIGERANYAGNGLTP